MSSMMLMREQFSLSTAWFGQHLLDVGYFGGAVRSDCSSTRQSPRLTHGGERHVSLSAGTHTSFVLHSRPFAQLPISRLALTPPPPPTLPLPMQFGKPHHKFEHCISLCSPPIMQELHKFESSTTFSAAAAEVTCFEAAGVFESTRPRERERESM
jgi:hypothetical protein